MKKTKLINLVLITFFLATLVFVYFCFPTMIMPDSTEYFGYLKILNGEESFSNWNVVRGPSLPLILFVITKIFSNTNFGLTVGTFIFYLLTIFVNVLVIRKIFKENNICKKVLYAIFVVAIAFNPILIGYMHGLLTEFVAMPVLTICTILSMKWIKTDKKIWKIFLPIILVYMCIFMWFLKQPYIFLALAPIMVAAIISCIEKKNAKNTIYRIAICFICIISVLVSNKIWNVILQKNNVNMGTGTDTDSLMKAAIINGNTAFSIDFYKEHYTEEYILNSTLIKNEDKEEILKIFNNESKYKSFKLVNVFNDFRSREETNIKEKRVMFSLEEQYTMGDSIKMFFKNVISYPFKTIEAYTLNYCSIADIVATTRHKDANEYYPSLTEGLYFENKSIGSSIYINENNLLWLDENHYLYNNIENLVVENNAPKLLKTIGIKLFRIYNGIYKLTILLLPILLVAIIVKRKKQRENNTKTILDIGIILIASSLLHVLFHTATGAIIDRYGFTIFPSAFVGILIFLFAKDNVEINMERKKIESNTNKTLTIIPAYNESQNIQKVIDELKKDFSETDILVINDSSKDNTKEIVEANNINCITTVFNLNYAYAVQTGIKYAKEHNYDYCIMFDGDGQHIAAEAKKLLQKIKETNCDIVIGSRYLEKGNYKAPKLRKIGTSFFTWLVKIATNKHISDPLSGFQIINRSVIDKYAKMGEYPEFPDANLIIEMLLDGYKIEEVSVKMRNREFGESMHGGIIKPIKYMIVMLYTITILMLNKIFGRSK